MSDRELNFSPVTLTVTGKLITQGRVVAGRVRRYETEETTVSCAEHPAFGRTYDAYGYACWAACKHLAREHGRTDLL